MSGFEVNDPIPDSPFEAGTYAKIVMKVIDDRGNELMVVKTPRGTK